MFSFHVALSCFPFMFLPFQVPFSMFPFHVPHSSSLSNVCLPCSPSIFPFHVLLPCSPFMFPFHVPLSCFPIHVPFSMSIWGRLGGCEQHSVQIVSSQLDSSSYGHANLVCSLLTWASQWVLWCVYRKNWFSTFCSQRPRTWRPLYVCACSSRLAFQLPVNALQNKRNGSVISDQRQTCWDGW